MSGGVRASLLRVLKVPGTPQPPPGEQGEVRVFRASPNFYRYNVARWALAQVGALGGLVAGLVFLRMGEEWSRAQGVWWLFGLLEALAWASFLVQLPVTFAMLRLDYQQRWYIVTERSLRIREGILTVTEKTLTFANIQNLTVRQGPLQRLLGISDLVVRTAGGGGARKQGKRVDEGTHTGYFHGVDDAAEIRALIGERVRMHRDSGLGDPDDAAGPARAASPPLAAPALDAARTLLTEARLLRAAFLPPGT